MQNQFHEKLTESPVIAAVKRPEDIKAALDSPCKIVFLLCGSIFNVRDVVENAHARGKIIFLHVDLLDGFSRDMVALRYIHENIRPDGIISTKYGQIKNAKELGLLAIQRMFILDSLSVQAAIRMAASIGPHAVEIMPGVMPKIITRLRKEIRSPLIAGGLVTEKEDVTAALNAGAVGVSTTNPALWAL